MEYIGVGDIVQLETEKNNAARYFQAVLANKMPLAWTYGSMNYEVDMLYTVEGVEFAELRYKFTHRSKLYWGTFPVPVSLLRKDSK